MNHSLVSLAAVVLAGVCLIAYLLGFAAGKDEGHDEGKKKGKKEGAVRAFAVGYDRGRRERKEGDEPADDPRLIVFVLLVVGTVILLTLAGVLWQRG